MYNNILLVNLAYLGNLPAFSGLCRVFRILSDSVGVSQICPICLILSALSISTIRGQSCRIQGK